MITRAEGLDHNQCLYPYSDNFQVNYETQAFFFLLDLNG